MSNEIEVSTGQQENQPSSASKGATSDSSEQTKKVPNSKKPQPAEAKERIQEPPKRKTFFEGQPEYKQMHIRPDNFQAQLVRQAQDAMWGGAEVDLQFDNSVEIITVVERDGKRIVLIPENPTLKQLLAAVKEVAKDYDGSQKTRTNNYIKNMKDLSCYMAQQRDSHGRDIFTDGVVEQVYNTALKMEAAVQGAEEPPRVSRERIETEPIELPISRINPNYTISDEFRQKLEHENEKRLLAFGLGAGDVHSFHERWFIRIQGKATVTMPGESEPVVIRTHDQFNEYLLLHKDDLVLPQVAQFVNTNERTQERGRQAVASHGAEALLDVISLRGEEFRKAMYEAMSFSRQQGRELGQITEKLMPPQTLIQNVERLLAELQEQNTNVSLQDKLRILNQAVYETYTFPENPGESLQQYAPALALKNGEFACTLRAEAVNDLVKIYMQDENLVRLGGSEFGHQTLLFVERDSLEEGQQITGYLMTTRGDIINGYYIAAVTDELLERPVMEKVKRAILGNPDVHVDVELLFSNTESQKNFGKYYSLANAEQSIESNLWVNLAITGVGTDGNPLDRETKLLYAERARVLDPSNVNAWRLIAQLTQGDLNAQELHRTALLKIHQLHADPELTDEKILKGRGTVDAPLIANADIAALIADHNDQGFLELVLNPKADADQLTEQEVDNAQNILTRAYVFHRDQNHPVEMAEIRRLLANVRQIETNVRTRIQQERQQEETRRLQRQQQLWQQEEARRVAAEQQRFQAAETRRIQLEQQAEARRIQLEQQEETRRIQFAAEQRSAFERREEEATLFSLTEVDKKNILEIGPIEWFLTESVYDLALRTKEGNAPGGTPYEAYSAKLRDAATFVTGLPDEEIAMHYKNGTDADVIEFKKQKEDFLGLQNEIVNVVVAGSLVQSGDKKAYQDAKEKVKNMTYNAIYRIRKLDDGKVGYITGRYLEELELQRLKDFGYLETHSIREVQTKMILNIIDEAKQGAGPYAEIYKKMKATTQKRLEDMEIRKYLIRTNLNPNQPVFAENASRRENQRIIDAARANNAQVRAILSLPNGDIDLQRIEQALFTEMTNRIRAHLIIARWTSWAVMDEPVITSKGVPRQKTGEKRGERRNDYTGRSNLWGQLQDMVRWGSLTNPQENLVEGPWFTRVTRNALISLVVKNKEIDRHDRWHPDSAYMRAKIVDPETGKQITRFEMVKRAIAPEQMVFQSDRIVDSKWRMGDREGIMDRPYLDTLYNGLKFNRSYGQNKNGEWVFRDRHGEVLTDRGYEKGLDFALFIQLHCATQGVDRNLDTVRAKRLALWEGRIAKYFPEMAMKMVYEKHPEDEVFIDAFTRNTDFLEIIGWNKVMSAAEIKAKREGLSQAERIAAMQEAGNEYNLARQNASTPSLLAKRRFELFMEIYGNVMAKYRQDGYHDQHGPRAINFGESGGSWESEMNTYFAALGDPNGGTNFRIMMNKLTKTVRGGHLNRDDNIRMSNPVKDEPITIAEKLAYDPTYVDIYSRVIRYDDSLLDIDRFRQPWEDDLSSKGTDASALYDDLFASVEAAEIVVNEVIKGDFNDVQKMLGAIMKIGELVVSPKGEEHRAQLIDNLAATYLYAMRIGSNEQLKGPNPLNRFLNFIGHNPTRAPWARNSSLISSEYGAQMMGFSDEEIEHIVNTQLSMYLQGDPIREAQLRIFLGITKGRIRNRSILRFLFALMVGSFQEFTGVLPEVAGVN